MDERRHSGTGESGGIFPLSHSGAEVVRSSHRSCGLPRPDYSRCLRMPRSTICWLVGVML